MLGDRRAHWQLDLVESYAKGSLSRREFVRRGAILGLSLPFMSAIISACGSDSGSSSDTSVPATGGATGGSAGPGKAGGTIKVAAQKPVSVDPVAMQDLGGYGLVAQVFEFLATLGDNGEIAPGLAESWEPNDDGTVWTFKLRQGVKWQDGTDFTSADVAATMDRMVEAGQAGLKGVIEKGAVDASDPAIAVFTLTGPNGNFPQLVSVFNAQSVITPVDYVTGTTLDKNVQRHRTLEAGRLRPGHRRQVRSATTPGGAARPPLDSTEFQFFDDLGTMVTAMQGGSVDAIVQFSVIGGDALLSSPDFNVLEVKSATHRQIWMRCDKGQFADKRGAPGVGPHLRPPADAGDAVQGPGRARQRPRHRLVHARLRPFGPSTGAGHRQGQAAAVRRRCHELEATLHIGRPPRDS